MSQPIRTDQTAASGASVVIRDCSGCGICCLETGSQAGIYLVLATQPKLAAEWPDQKDVKRIEAIPQAAWQAILQHRDIVSDVCAWFDEDAGRCRWYRLRPQVCRVLRRGSAGCRSFRDDYNLDVDAIMGTVSVPRSVPG
jgi:Fe-S-cluster containining protein